MSKKSCKMTSIGGQALIEGVMMKGVSETAMAVRLPDGTIEVEKWQTKSPKDRPFWFRVPFLRGIFNFVDTMITGYKTLMKSAEKSGFEDEEEPSKFDKWLNDKLGDKVMAVVSVLSLVLSMVLALALFMFLPAFVVWGVEKLGLPLGGFKTLVEGVIKMAVFLLYIALTAKMKEIKRVYGYHGAEHKSIACYEHGEELTVENVRKHSRFHPRCGTSFMFLVLFVSILVFSVFQVPWDNLLLRVLIKVALLPLIVGIGYELIKLAGRHQNWFTKIFSAPGLWIQRITTNEPEDDQIEVAIESLKAVLPHEGEDDNW